MFRHPRDLPPGRQATYLRVVEDCRPNKAESFRIRWTVGGNRMKYFGVTYTPSADLITIKILLNSVISTPDAKFLGLDAKDF